VPAHRRDDVDAAARDPARVLGDDEVDVALAVTGVDVGETVPLLGQRADRLREQGALGDLDRQPTQSPRSSRLNASNASSPIAPRLTNSWIVAPRSSTVAKLNLPCRRSSRMRPATWTAVSVVVPASRSPKRSCSSAAVASASKRTG
jgi:hypothetical protein